VDFVIGGVGEFLANNIIALMKTKKEMEVNE